MLKDFNEKHSRWLFISLHAVFAVACGVYDVYYLPLYSRFDGYLGFAPVIVPLAAIPFLMALRCWRLAATVALSMAALAGLGACFLAAGFAWWLANWGGGWK